ncbi:MAG: DUF748 domain-containing protein [Ichthyobacteriaceae bacterium]|nr:DUF748 domain-containing protein [Ichthyobacteriaceae bacterium]
MNYKKIILITSVLLLILLIVVLLSAPTFVKNYINKNGKELVGRKILVDEFSFNFINGEADIQNFKMYEEDEKTIFVKIDSLHLNLIINKLFSKEVYVESLYISEPEVNFSIKNKVFNFKSLSSNKNTKSEKDKNSKHKKSTFKYSLNNSEIKGGVLKYTNHDKNINHKIEKLNFKLPQIVLGEVDADAVIDFKLANGTILANVNYVAETGDFNLDIKINKLNVHEAMPYLEPKIILSDMQGDLSASIIMKGNTLNPADLIFNGRVELNSLNVIDSTDLKFLSIKQIKLKVDKVDLEKMRFNIDSVYIHKADFVYQQYKLITNIDRLFYDAAQDVSSSVEDSVAVTKDVTVKWRVNNLHLDKSSIDFTDYSLNPKNFNYKLFNIDIKGQDVALGNDVKFKLLSDTPNGGKLNADISTDPGNTRNGWFNLYLTNVVTKDFSPYSVYYFAFPITGGKFNFEVKNKIKDNYIRSMMVLDAYGTKIADKDKSVKAKNNVPLKLAVVALSDKDKRINFKVPMHGDLNDPEFSYGKSILKVITTLLVKVAASPVNLLAKGLGVDKEKIKTIKIDELKYELGPEQTTRLDLIIKLLNEKEELKADAKLYVDVDDEKGEMAVVRAKSRFYLNKLYKNDTLYVKLTDPDYAQIDEIDINNENLTNYLVSKLNIKADSLNNKEMCKLLVPAKEVDNLYDDLNRLRIEKVKSYLSKVDSVRVYVSSELFDKKIIGDPYFEFDYRVGE